MIMYMDLLVSWGINNDYVLFKYVFLGWFEFYKWVEVGLLIGCILVNVDKIGVKFDL